MDNKAMTFKTKQKKSQSKLFHAIENGDFGDLDLPTGELDKSTSLVDQFVSVLMSQNPQRRIRTSTFRPSYRSSGTKIDQSRLRRNVNALWIA